MSSSSSRLAATLALLAAASTSLASPLAAQRPDDRRDIRPSTRPESRAVAAAAGVPAALADSGSAGVAGGSTAEEPAYLELVLPPLQSQTVTVYRRRDLAFVALDDIASLAGVRPAESGARRWRGALGLRGTELDVDVDLHRVTTDGRPLDARADEVLARQGHVYLASSLLARAIGLRAEVDWDVLALRFAGGDSLPAVQRIRRMQAYATVLERRAATASADRVDRALDRTRSLLGGLSVDYSVSMPTGTGRTRQPSFLLTGGSEVLGGALQVQAQGDAGQTRALWSWTDVHTGHAWFQQFRVGNVTTGGPRARPVSGVVVSNAPYIRTSTLGNAPFEGELGPGWIVEAYRGGELVDVDSTGMGARFRFDLPIVYGENSITFVAYGPAGERRVFQRQYRLPTELLPARRVEYHLSGGACRIPLCRKTATADLRYGLTGRWTLEGGADAYQLRGGSLAGRLDTAMVVLTPYVGFTGTPLNALTIDANVTLRADAHGAIRFEPTPDVRLSVEHTHYGIGGTPLRLLAADSLATDAPLVGTSDPVTALSGFPTPWRPTPDRRDESLLTLFVRPGAFGRDRLFFDASLTRTLTERLETDQVLAAGSLRVASLFVQPFLRTTRAALRPSAFPVGVDGAPLSSAAGIASVTGLRLTGSPFAMFRRGSGLSLGPAGRALAPVFVSVSTERDRDGLSATSGQVFRTFGAGVRLAATAEWRRGSPGTAVTLQANLDRSLFRLMSSATRTAAGVTTGQQMLSGSLVWNDASHRLAPTPGSAMSLGGVSGRAFVDENNNGRLDAGEQPLRGVGVEAGGQSAATDPRGRYHLTNLQPFTPVVVSLDTTARADLSVVPLAAAVRVVPPPNHAVTLDIPFVAAASIEGTVQLHVGRTTVAQPGVPVVAVHRGTGKRTRAVTFTDGTFYLGGLAPGDYDVSVGPEALAVARWKTTTARLALPLAPGGVHRQGVLVHLTSTDAAPAGDAGDTPQ